MKRKRGSDRKTSLALRVSVSNPNDNRSKNIAKEEQKLSECVVRLRCA